MNARVTAALLALAAAGCGTSAANTVGARLQGPTAIVAFVGATPKNGGQLHDYFAIASSRGDELVFLDPGDEQPVLGPGAVFPLVVPTAPSPLLLAAAPLGDATDTTATADLLVAVGAGGRSLQLVNTWDPTANRIVAEVDLSPGLQAGIVSVAAMTVPGANPPQARVIVGAAGQQLAVVTYQRAAAGGGIEALPFDPAADVRSLGFEPRSMAVEPAPADPAAARLFVATPDLIGATRGVAQLTMTGAIASWPVAALDARAGTTLVAAARVRELKVPPAGQVNAQAREIFDSTELLRVYAVLDTATCGAAGRIACGLATLDPGAGGLAADPGAGAILVPPPAPPAVPPQGYRAPIQVPAGVISGIAFAFPAAERPSPPQTPGPERDTTDPLNPGIPQLTTTSAVRSRKTTAVAALTSSDGRTYLVDLGRYDFLEDATPLGILSSPVTAASSISAGSGPLLGLHGDYAPVAGANVPGVSTDPVELPDLIVATPGFTPADTWTVTYQGVLPGLANVRGLLVESNGTVHVAAQSGDVVTAPVTAPELGIRPNPGHLSDNDTVVVTCADGSATEASIAEILPAGSVGTVSVPGGALKLAAGTPLACGLAPGGPVPVTFSVRAARYVLAGAALGYAGRPELDTPFSLAWQGEDSGLAAEDLALVKKARRRRYVTEAACVAADGSGTITPGCYGRGLRGIVDPLAPGPVVSFELGLSPATGASPVVRDTHIAFSTQAGRSPVSRRPLSAGVLPQAITSFDVSKFPGRENEAVRIYAAYSDDQILVFTPAGTAGDVKSIR
ncbi:MAG: hypothetical protein ACJ79E_17635 [Anaeromyxobacteraceae bacterium]